MKNKMQRLINCLKFVPQNEIHNENEMGKETLEGREGLQVLRRVPQRRHVRELPAAAKKNYKERNQPLKSVTVRERVHFKEEVGLTSQSAWWCCETCFCYRDKADPM